MKRDSFDDARYTALAAEALSRGRSLEAPRPLPVMRHARPMAAVPILQIRPDDQAVDRAFLRISERSERVEKAMAAERQRMDEAKAPKRRTRPVKVDSPYGRSTNGQDDVERVIDTIDLMLRARQIDRGQEAAARRVQEAWAAAPNALRCTLSPGAGGAGPGSTSPTENQLWAGNVLNDVRAALGELDAPIVIRIAGMGMSVEETARMVFGGRDAESKVSDREIHHVGMRFRMGVAHLARRWRIEGKGGAKVVGLRGAKAGHENSQNFGEMSEAERERFMPLRTAAEQRDVRLAKKIKRRKKARERAAEGQQGA